MTKKRLADLLREEAQQSPDLETEAIQETAPGQPLAPDPTLSEAEPLDETTAEPSSANMSVAPRAKRLGPPTKAELETTATELREALQLAHDRESSLQQQLADLQLELQEQKRLVENSQADLEQAKQLKVEFEQAKEVILKLTEANSKKSSEGSTVKQKDEGFKSQNLGLKKIPYHSIQPSAPSTKLSNADVGWVD